MEDKRKKVLIIVSAYNEEQTIESTVNAIKRNGYFNILIVDDGSTDTTFEIANRLNIYVVRHLFNRGLGSALATGFEIARILDYDIIVTFDADGQHDPEDIAKLIEPVQNEEADAVIGTRMLSRKGMPWSRVLFNKIANLATYIIYGFSMSDTQSGLRVFNKKAYNLLNIETPRMECSSEIVYKMKKYGLISKEVKIKSIYTDYSLSKGQDLIEGVKTLFRLIISRLARRE